MEDYYKQPGVRRAIIDFIYSGYSSPCREGAFFNERIGEMQRHSPEKEKDALLVIDSEEKFAKALRSGGKAFYASYWRYSNPSEAKGVKGRDLTWSIKASEGGLSAAKKVTQLFLEALEEEGFPQPLVKYSGKLGFDVMIPLEDIQSGSPEDLDFLKEVHEELTEAASGFIDTNSSYNLINHSSRLRFAGKSGTCLLTELRWRRGLILAPMSLHPGSGLVSVPLLPNEVSGFSVIEASPEKVHAREWSVGQTIPKDRSEMIVGPVARGTSIRT